MCIYEELQKVIEDNIAYQENLIEESSDTGCECGISISIKVSPVHLDGEKEIKTRVERISKYNIYHGILISNDTSIFIKRHLEKKPFHCHCLACAICYSVRINGGEDSFAIVKFYKGNCMTEGAVLVYEDFVTPGYTLDLIKLERFIKTALS